MKILSLFLLLLMVACAAPVERDQFCAENPRVFSWVPCHDSGDGDGGSGGDS